MVRLNSVRPFQLLKRFMPKNLYSRVLVIMMLPLFLVVAITTFTFFDLHWEQVTHRLADDIAGEVVLVVDLVNIQERQINQIAKVAASNFHFQVSLRSEFKRARRASSIMRSLGTKFLRKSLKTKLTKPHRVFINKRHILVEVTLADKEYLNIKMPRNRLLSKTTPVFLMWLWGTPILFFVIAVLFLRNQVRPIKNLARAAEQFGKGSAIKPFKTGGANEVRQAAQAFNQMRERIARQITQRTEMLAGISHDLRTLLTRMELQLAMGDDPDAISNLRSDVKEMTKMVEAYLAFASGESGESPQNTNFKLLIGEVLEKTRCDKITVQLDCDEEINTGLRQQAFKRCMHNLIENAKRYANTIWITAQQSNEWIIINIDDNGPGIPANKRNDVLKPFFRLDKSRNLDHGGVGLGLAIAADSVHQHGGCISLANSPAGGLRVTLKIPHNLSPT